MSHCRLLLRRFLMRYCVLFCAALLGCCTLAQAANQTSPSQANVPAPETFGAWTKICSLPPGTPNIQCEVVQNVRAANRPDIAFRISLLKVPQNNAILMRVFVPIRVELQLGVGIKVDDKDMGKMQYRRCLGDTCVAEAFLKNEEFQAFLVGQTATYYIFTTPQEGVGGTVDLKGLNTAFKALPGK